MKKSEIHVGDEVCVYIDSPFFPHGSLEWGKSREEGKQLSDHLHSTRNLGSGRYSHVDLNYHGKKGTVVEIGAPRIVSNSYHYHVFKVVNDGVLVKLDEPVASSWDSKKSGRTFMATTRQIIEPWAKTEGRMKAANDEYTRMVLACDSFEPRLKAFIAKLKEIGFGKIEVYNDGSGIHAAGLTISLRSWYDKETHKSRAYSFQEFGSVDMDLGAFLAITGIDRDSFKEED